ncbi:MAG TPA: hypothetical protein VJ793_00590 [Anaerolineae bacterium]|nr:hypothetical protein [Anaerolineae bacterium]
MTIVRDLMKPVYIFGRHEPADQHITQLDAALAKLKAGKNFYVRASDRVYYVNVGFYCTNGIPVEQVANLLRMLLQPPEAAWL